MARDIAVGLYRDGHKERIELLDIKDGMSINMTNGVVTEQFRDCHRIVHLDEIRVNYMRELAELEKDA